MNNRNLQQLRNFGLIMSLMLIIFFAVLIPWIWGMGFPIWPWVAASVFVLLSMAIPQALAPIYSIWMKIGHGLGWINSRILLSVVFYLLITPTGALLRVFGKDPIARAYDFAKQTYRVESKTPSRDNLEKPF